MSVSLMTIEPRSGFSRPTSDFRNTDLPVPEGPRRTEISPGGKVRVTSLQMFWLPKDFVSPSTSTATPTSYLPLRSGCSAGSPPRRVDESRQCATPLPGPHPDDREPLLLTGNDSASKRLRVSRVSRDLDLQTSPGRARRSPGRGSQPTKGAQAGPGVRWRRRLPVPEGERRPESGRRPHPPRGAPPREPPSPRPRP